MSTTIKVGDTVNWSGSWGRDPVKEATVVGIELCEAPGMKEGESVDSITVEDKDRCVFDLSNGHWAYGTQIQPINKY
jgi:hypothetical protein